MRVGRKVVYVLGAGFSYGTGHKAKVGASVLSMPLQNNLFETINKVYHRKIEELDDVARVIRKYFSPGTYRPTKGRGISRNQDLFGISIEEIMTFFDEMGQRDDEEDVDSIRKAEDMLLVAVVELITRLSKASIDENKILKIFVERLAKTDAVITFNWDTLLDQALQKWGDWHPSFGYGETARDPKIGLEYSKRKDDHQKPPNKYLRLLKLHGSINWLAHGDVKRITNNFAPEKRFKDVIMMPPTDICIIQ